MSITPDSPQVVRRPSLFKDPTTLFQQHTAQGVAQGPPRIVTQPLVSQPLATPGVVNAALPLFYCVDLVECDEIDLQQTWRLPVWPALHDSASFSDWSTALKLLRNLVRDSGTYALVACLSPFLSLILTPFLTHSLSRADYGVLAVINATIVFLAGLTQFGLGAAFSYGYNSDYHASVAGQQVAFSTMVRLLCLCSLLVAVLLWLCAPSMAQLLFHSALYTAQIKLMAVLIALQNLSMPGLTWLRLTGRATFFAVLTALGAIGNLLLTLLFVGVLHMGCYGALWSSCGALLLPVLGTGPLVVRLLRPRFQLAVAYDLLAFGISTLPGLLSVWVLQLVDRYFLLSMSSLAQTASYSVAYTLGNVAAPLVIAPFALAWYSILHALARNTRAHELFRQVFRWYSALLLFTACLIATCAHLLLRWFFPPAYASLSAIIPLIALANVWYGLFDIFSVGVHVQRKIWYSVIYLPAAALLNLCLNLLLIPRYGAVGAALATMLAYFALAVMAYIVNQYVYAIAFELARFGLALVLGIGCYAAVQWILQSPALSEPLRCLLTALLLILYAVILVRLCKIPLGKVLAYRRVRV